MSHCQSVINSLRFDVPRWFCVQSRPKHEHIAAANLRSTLQLPVFSPRVRYRRRLPTGSMWVSEALFPCYLFALVTTAVEFESVRYSAGVRDIVHFGSHYPAVPGEVIEELRARVGAEETVVHSIEFVPGDSVNVQSGPFVGLEAVVLRPMPARQRVRVLLTVLGRQTEVEVDAGTLGGRRRYPDELLAATS